MSTLSPMSLASVTCVPTDHWCYTRNILAYEIKVPHIWISNLDCVLKLHAHQNAMVRASLRDYLLAEFNFPGSLIKMESLSLCGAEIQ